MQGGWCRQLWSAAVLVVCLSQLASSQDLRKQTCTQENKVTLQEGATAWLAGIVSFNSFGSGGYGCGVPSGSMQAFEAMRWVLELLNKKNEKIQTENVTDYYVPGIRLGMKVENYCNNDQVALASLSDVYPELLDACPVNTEKMTFGVIGPSRSGDALVLSKEAQDYNIPVISYEATASVLTMSGLFHNFMRTISPDGPLMDVIVAALEKLNWDFIAVVYDDSDYGRTAFSELNSRLAAKNICLTIGVMVDGNNLANAGDTLSRVLNTEAVGVIHFGPANFAKELIKTGNDRLGENSGRLQWMLADFPVDTVFEASSVYQRGILTVSAASRYIVEFEDHWIRLDEATHSNTPTENPWFTSWYEQRNDCSFNPGSGQRDCAAENRGLTQAQIEDKKRVAYEQNQYVEAAVMAVFTYANALRNAQIAKCGEGNSGPCSAFKAMTRQEFYEDYVKKVDFAFSKTERVPSLASYNIPPYNDIKRLSFKANGDISNPSYYIWNYNDIETGAGSDDFKFRRVGSYISGRLDLNNVGMYSADRQTRLVPLPASPCPAQGCMPCLGLPVDLKYYYEPGDAVINGIFSLHAMGMTPLSCGESMSPRTYQFLEAMIFAIKQVNNNNNILTSMRLGGLGLDDCSSSILGQAYLVQVQRGQIKITNAAGGDALDPQSIQAYTAAHTTPLTLPLAEAMNLLLKPMVGYRAGGSKLRDGEMYPYYLMAEPGVYEEMLAIVLLLKKWEWNHVQVVTSQEYFSMDAEETFRDLAAAHNICVVATHHMMNYGSMAGQPVLRGLMANQHVQPVISLLEAKGNRQFLMALKSEPSVRDHFTIIATTRWGKSEMVVEGYEDVADGVLTLSLPHSTLQQFQNHLKGLNPTTYQTNPWFSEWYQAVHNCSAVAGVGGLPACNYAMDITEGSDFHLQYEVEAVINAVYAISHGLDSLLRKYCGNGATQMCRAFTNADKGMEFVEAIRSAKFSMEDHFNPARQFSFSGRTGEIPFKLNNYRVTSKSYVEVREINPWTSSITVTATIYGHSGQPIDRVTTGCPSPCLECLYMFQHINYWHIPGDLLIGAIFDVHYAGTGPFNCGALRAQNGALYTELFNFALREINSGSRGVTLDKFTLGGLAFDGCTNPPRAKAIVNQVHTGMERLMVTGEPFDVKSLVSWMTYDSATTIQIAELLNALNMPLISPAATSSVLDDKEMYRTFFRTIPSDSILAKGMAEFVKEMNWKYVVTVTSPDDANRHAQQVFRDYLKAYGICVIANYEFATDGSYAVILKSIKETGTQVVAIFSEPDRYVEELVRTNADRNWNIKYIANRPWGRFTERYTGDLTSANRDLVDSVYFEAPNFSIGDFTVYLSQGGKSNPWFNEIYEQWMNCYMPGSPEANRQPCDMSKSITSGENWEQDIWTLTTMNAIYSVAEAVNMLKIARCGQGTPGICDAFYHTDPMTAIMTNLDILNFTDISGQFFEFIRREANRGFKLMRYQEQSVPVEEGSLDTQGNLALKSREDLLKHYDDVKSECSGDCFVCTATDGDIQTFSLIDGEIYIVGLFDIHKKGSTPFSCGAINDKHGLPLLEAFNYAIEYVNDKRGHFRDLLPGIRLGGVALDMCQSPTRAANIVSNIHNGNIQLVKGGEKVNPRRIDAYIGTMDTESSIRVADVLTQISMPQISYGAMGMELLDRNKYNFFLRSVPADDKQARAIVSYLKKFKFNNIQVIYSFDEIGEPGLEEFEKVTQANLICVKTKHIVGKSGMVTAAEANDLVNKLENNNDTGSPKAEVIVVWMKNPLPILEAASANVAVSQSFLFIATDKWGADPAYLKNVRLQNLLQNRNLITLDVETADIPGYDKYLENKTPDNYFRNPWFKEYFEEHQDCYWDESTTARTTPCDKSSTIPRADNYVQDPYVLYVVNAVFSAAMAIDDAIKNLCGSSIAFGVCNLYKTSGERRENVLSSLLKVNFIDDTYQPFFYTSDGQSDRGFHIYNVTSEEGEFVYTDVGSYNDSHFLKLDITYEVSFSARCNADGSDPALKDCVCPFPGRKPSRYMKKDDGNRGLTLVYVGDIHQQDPEHTLGCGPINTGADLQKMLAFFYAIDLVNANAGSTLMDSIKLDGLALDSCTHGLRLGQDVYNVLSGNQLCDANVDNELVSPNSIVSFIVDKDKNTIPLSDMLTQYKITSISPTARNAQLSDRYMYPYFLRTKGDDQSLGNVIFKIAQKAGWNFLSVIYSNNLSQGSASRTLTSMSQGHSVCLGAVVPLAMDAGLTEARLVLELISKQGGANAVVLLVEPAHLTLLLQASNNLGLTGRFTWIIPADWSYGNSLAGLESELAGSIKIETRSAIVDQFNEYMKSLTFTNRRGIPNDWFLEIYEALHQCNVLREDTHQRRFPRVCTEDERITDDMLTQDPDVLHVIISVYASAQGLEKIPDCRASNLDIAACLQIIGDQRNQKIYNGISDVNFQVLPQQLDANSFRFFFDAKGEGMAGYVISNYRATNANDRPGDLVNPYGTFVLGTYAESDLTLDLSNFASSNLLTKGTVPESRCPIALTCTCQGSDGSTWTLAPQPNVEVIVGRIYEGPLSDTPVYVKGIPSTGDRFDDTWAIIVTVIAAVGAFISLAVFFYLLVMYPVRGGTSILGYMLTFGIILLYLMVIPFIAHANKEICGLRRFGLGFVYALVYSSLLVKLIDCWRVRGKAEAYDVKYSKLGRPAGLFMVTVLFVAVQIMISTEWLILEQPDMTRVFYKGYYWPRCTDNGSYDESLVMSLIYIMAIIVFSLFLGLFTYTSKKNHRESRWILGILILSVPCWVIWCLVATLGTYKVRDAAVAIGLLVNATIMLLLVPIRKLYLLHKYNVLIEEEEEKEEEAKSHLTASQRGSQYNYGHHYDNNPRLQDSGSNVGSGY